MNRPYVPLFSVATVNDDVLSETTDPDLSFDYVDISSISDFKVSESLARFTFQEAPSRARRLAKPGDVVLSTVRTYLRSIAPITKQNSDSVFSTGFAIIRPNPSVCNPAFLRYATLSNEFIDSIVSHSNGVSYPTINATDVMRLRIPLPPLHEQQRIADYLDRETAEIDAAVAHLDKYVELLEKRLAHFVSQSLGKDRFPLVPVFTLASLSAGAGITAESIEDSGTYPVYGGNGLRGYTEVFNQSADRILIGRQGALCGNVHYAPGPLFASEHALVVDPRVSLNLIWFEHALRDLNLRTLSQASAQPGISASEVSRQRVHLPPREEQDAIAQLISNEVKQTRQIIGESLKLRNLLLKRRSVLITEVVTGRKQV